MKLSNEAEFQTNQQMLALQIARLPVLRRELQDAHKMVNEGRIGNAISQEMQYLECVRWIKQLAGEL